MNLYEYSCISQYEKKINFYVNEGRDKKNCFKTENFQIWL